MKLTREQARNLSGGGSSYFKLDEGKSAMVRFLYNTMDDMEPEACHSVKDPNGQSQYPQNVLCARETEASPKSDCIYCEQGLAQVARYIVPIYNEDTKEIQYWVRSSNFEKKLAVHTEDFNGKAPISGQVFKIIRTGSGTSTDYELIKTGDNDNRTRDSFGELKTNDELKMIKPGNYQFPVKAQGNFGNQNFGGQQQNGFGNQNFGGQQFNSTRRTTDMF
jgi:hypothetical protein